MSLYLLHLCQKNPQLQSLLYAVHSQITYTVKILFCFSRINMHLCVLVKLLSPVFLVYLGFVNIYNVGVSLISIF